MALEHHNQEKQDRLAKLEAIKALGINPYPSKYSKTHTVKQALESVENNEVKISGRVMSIREMGGLIFAHVQDNSGKIQIVLEKKDLKEKNYTNTDINYFQFFRKYIDIADFIGVNGKIFTTKKGELSVLVQEFTILTKSLLPLPEKWHGIKNEEEKFRKRYLDILMNPEIKELFIKKQKFWNVTRTFLLDKGFSEIETPTLEITTGGAEARPFITHHNDYDLDVYLRISVGELWQKRLMAAGFDKTFEIGRVYRNEGSSPEHLQEFTNMEFYWAYADYTDGMKLTKELYRTIAEKVFNTTKFETRGHKFDLADEWEEIDYVTKVEELTGINVLTSTEDEMVNKLKELNIKYEGTNKERLTDTLWKYCRKQISGPAFLINHPKLVSPLAKENANKHGQVQRFQPILAGSEIGNGYSELNNPIDQKERFETQKKLLEAGDDEAMMPDFEFVEMLEHGMPPTCGFGFGERLFAFLANKTAREITLFPFMKPHNNEPRNNNPETSKKEKVTNSPKMELNITREEAWTLINEHNKEKANLNHYIEAEVIMKGIAKHLGEDEHVWGMAGLLHDLDWELTCNTHSQHGAKTVEFLKEYNLPEKFIYAIKAHNNKCLEEEVPPVSSLDYALRSCETVTGLIYASVLVRPDKKIENLQLKSLKKKFKDKKFAANCNRDMIKECEHLGLSLDEFLQIALDSMKTIASEIGL